MSAPPPSLILVGHGSARQPGGAAPILALADELRGRGLFLDVKTAFMKQPPLVETALEGTGGDVVVVPVFAGKGYYTDMLIPRQMGLSGPVTRLGERRVFYAPPIGTHGCIPHLLARRALAVAVREGWEPRATSLLLIAHGSSRPGGAGETPRAIAAALAERDDFAEVVLTFLEQDPQAAHWPTMVSRPAVVVMPLLIAQGMHASADIPPLFGLHPGDTGPCRAHGHSVRLTSGMGDEPELAEIVIDMVRAAMANNPPEKPFAQA